MLKFSDKLLSAWVRSTANTLSSLFVLFMKSMLKLFLSNLYTRSDGIRLFANWFKLFNEKFPLNSIIFPLIIPIKLGDFSIFNDNVKFILLTELNVLNPISF